MLGHKVWADVLDFYVLVIDWGQNVISLFHFFFCVWKTCRNADK